MSTASIAPWIAALGSVGVATATWLAPLGAAGADAAPVAIVVTPPPPVVLLARDAPKPEPHAPEPSRDENADQGLVVEHGGSYWPCTIVAHEPDGQQKVHYIGWGPESDEVVASSRIRRRSGSSLGQLVVEWHGSYWPATALRSDGGRIFIRYDGYGAEWDEWVGPDRTARLSPPTRPPAR